MLGTVCRQYDNTQYRQVGKQVLDYDNSGKLASCNDKINQLLVKTDTSLPGIVQKSKYYNLLNINL